MIPAEVFALANGFFSAVNLILLKKGLTQSNAVTAILVSLLINVVVFWTLVVLLVPAGEIWQPGLFIFMLVGLIQPGGTRFLSYLSVQKVGVAVTAPLRATTPLFSSMAAILILGEQMTVPVAAGTFFIVCGIVLLSLRSKGNGEDWRSVYIVLPLLSALVAGTTQVIRKIGLVHLPLPILGAAVTTTTSLLVVSLSLLVSRKMVTLEFSRYSLTFFILGGMAVTLGVASVYMSLHLADVVIVGPLASLSPLYSLILAAIFLRDLEVITPRIILSGCIIISGVLLITVRL